MIKLGTPKPRSRYSMPSSAPVNKFVPISSLSVGVGEDAQVVLSAFYKKTTRGTYVTNSPGNSGYLCPRAIGRFAIHFGSGENTDSTSLGRRHRPRMGRIAIRAFTDLQNRGEWTYVVPSFSAGGGAFIHEFTSPNQFIEFRPVGPCDAEGSSPALESMRTSEESGIADRGMWWEITGFSVNAEARFDLVRIPQFKKEVLSQSDSNGAGNTEPTAGGAYYENESPRAALIGQAINSSFWDPIGINGQWKIGLHEAHCASRGFHLDLAASHHGGAHQTVCGPNTRANIEAFWPGYYLDLIDRMFSPFHGSTSILDSLHFSGGTWRPREVDVDSFANDLLRAVYEYLNLFGASGEQYFSGATIQANAKALADYIIATVPTAKMFVVSSSQTDAGAGGVVDTMARVRAAFTGGGGTGRMFQNGATTGAEASIGLFMSLSDYAATTGIPTTLTAVTHYTQAQHAAIVTAILTIYSTWFDQAFGIIYVDGTDGNNANAGTYASPKKTATGAGSAAMIGIKRGTDGGALSLAASGTSTVPKTVFAYDTGAAATLTSLNTNAKSNVWIHGLTVTGGITVASGTGIRFSHVIAAGHTSHGWNISGGTVTLEQCEGNTNGGNGFNITGGTITGRLTRASGNVGSGVLCSGGTFTEDGPHIHSNDSHAFSNTGGTVTMRNGKISTKDEPAASFLAAVQGTAGTTTIEQMHIHDAADDGTTPSYWIHAHSTNVLAVRNCVFSRFAPSQVNGLVWLYSFGASGNIRQWQNCAFADDSDQPFRYGYGVNLGELALPGHSVIYSTFRTWTDKSARILAQNSVMGTLGFTATASSEITDDAPAAGTIAEGIGASIGVTKDYFKRTRVDANAGPWGDFE